MTISAHFCTDNPSTASNWLQQGRLLAYPTESVWGIGCDAMKAEAVQQILAIKRRPIDKGMIVVTDSMARLEPLLGGLAPVYRQRLAQTWQRHSHPIPAAQAYATTWLIPVPKAMPMPVWLTGHHQSLAVRVIAHPLIAKLCAQLVSSDNPMGLLVSTSCNRSGDAPAQSLAEAYAYFADSIAYLQGQTLGYQRPSQIKDVLSGKVLR